MTKKSLKDKLKILEGTYNSALSTFLVSNKRMDRDRVLKLRGKLDLLIELINDYK